MSTVRARRRSLLDMTQSPKPTLLMKDRQNLQDSGQGSVAAPAVGNKKNQSIEFQMPSGSQLSNLCKIQVSLMLLRLAGGEVLGVDDEGVK